MKYFKTFEEIDAIIDDVFNTYQQMEDPKTKRATIEALIQELKPDTSAVEQKVEEFYYECPEKKEQYEDLDYIVVYQKRDFYNWLVEDFEIKYDNLMNVFQQINVHGKIEIWREMKVNKKWLDVLKNDTKMSLGLYWSYEENAAEAHWGHNVKDEYYVTIHATCDFDKVNWYKTMLANLQPNTGDEQEINLPKGTLLNVLDITMYKVFRENHQAISFNKNITFVA